jgi:hypothetical protein
MIRPFTCLTVLLAAGSGLYLYSEKHKTTLLDDRIRAVVDNTHRIEDRTSMLRAEWALLNQPDRLQTLAAKYLPRLQPMAPTQFVQASDLDRQLPAIGRPREPYGPPAPVVIPSTPAAPPTLVAGVTPKAAPQDSAPVKVAVRVAAKPTMRLALAREHHSADVTHHTTVASVAGMRLPRQLAPAIRQAVSYTPAPLLSGTWHPASIAGPVFTGSALGMAHMTMAPPMAAR